MIICGGDLKYVNDNQWVDDDADDHGGDDHGGDDHGGGDGDKTGKIRKSKFPKIVKKSLKNQKKSDKIDKNPKITIPFRCAKLRENPENQDFTFLLF